MVVIDLDCADGYPYILFENACGRLVTHKVLLGFTQPNGHTCSATHAGLHTLHTAARIEIDDRSCCGKSEIAMPPR
jgi:hypothetical protein